MLDLSISESLNALDEGFGGQNMNQIEYSNIEDTQLYNSGKSVQLVFQRFNSQLDPCAIRVDSFSLSEITAG